MRIAYINHGRFPTEKAYGSQIAQVCDALAELGHDVTLLCPTFHSGIASAPDRYYGLRRALHIERVDHFDAFQSSLVPGFLGFAVSMRSYGQALQKYLAGHKNFDLAYVRSPLLVGNLLRTGIPVILELHSLPRFCRRRFTHACNHCAKVVCLTSPMHDQLVSWGVKPEKVIVEADGVDLRRFEHLPITSDAKKKWDLPSDRPVIGYVGALATRETLEKGVRDLIDSMGILRDLPLPSLPLLWIVGGPEKWRKEYEDHARLNGLHTHSIRFQGRIESSAVPSAMAACDVCVYPAPKSDHPYFQRDTSPLKLFEYLAAGKPVVCADIPPIRDVVDDRSVRLYQPGDLHDLAAAIGDALRHPDKARQLSEAGKRIAQDHSWEKRMTRILSS